MTDKNTPVKSQEKRQSELAPEMHNDEQDDHRSQAQEVSEQAQSGEADGPSPTESTKPATPDAEMLGGNEEDLIDGMRKMEDSGKIDTGAFAGEPNHDDNTKKYKTGK